MLSSFDNSSIEILKTILSSKCYTLNDPNKPELRRNVTVKRKTNINNNNSPLTMSQFTSNLSAKSVYDNKMASE